MNFGVTIHKVDPGIDTGDIIYQKTCEVNYSDNFSTYPLYQYALAIPLLIQAISDIQNTNLKTFKKEEVESKLYYHPTFTSYVWAYLKYGVK
jgi:methionyl-tRNA formyltransferase